MSSAPTSASGSALPRGQILESLVAPAHGVASSTRSDSAPASSSPEPESCRSRALNPLAKAFIPGNASNPSENPRSSFPAEETAPARKPLKENESSEDGVMKTSSHPEHAPRLAASAQPGKASLQVNNSSARRGHSWNANHLLNFQYDPIVRSNPRAAPPARRQHHHHSKQPAYDKELFLQANFRFLVSDCGDYLENNTDPDKMLEWKDIAVVELSSSAEIQCPICLDSPPLCPQITSCGHIFCFPCILRYFTEGEDENRGDYWKKCPLCFTRTSCRDLRTVHIHRVSPVKPGESLSFTLLARAKGSVIPLRSDAYSRDLYSKFTLTSDIEQATSDAIAELTAWAERAQYGDDEGGQLPFVFAAIDQLKLRKAAWDEHRTLEFLSSSPPVQQRILAHAKAGVSSKVSGGIVASQKPEASSPAAPTAAAAESKGAVYNINPFSDELEIVSPVVDESGKLGSPEKEPEEVDIYSFYQAADGQLILMHPVSMKCLVHHYGSYKNLPHSVQGKVLEMENIVQTEATRKRYRYLSHLPLTSMFQLCEIDLSEALPRSSLAPFRDELKARESRRQRQLKQERMLKSAAEKAEQKQVPPTPQDYIAIMNVLRDDEIPVAADFAESVVSSPAPIIAEPPAPPDERRLFSNVAKLGFAAGHDAPDLIHGVSTLRQAPEAGPSSSGVLSFADVIQKEKEKTQEPSPRGSNKGKKSQKVLLSTTGGRRYGK